MTTTDNPTSAFATPTDSVAAAHFEDFHEITCKGCNRLVRARRSERWWVLKGLKPEYRDSQLHKSGLKKEFDLLVSLQHPGIPSVAALEDVEGIGLCIVTEWVDGEPLTDWQTDKTEKERLAVALLLLDTIRYVHDRHLAYRDLKPENVIVTGNCNRVKLINFALADTDSHDAFLQPAATEADIATTPSQGLVTNRYNDIFSLGCILEPLLPEKRYRKVVARCKAPLEKRYAGVGALGSDLLRARRKRTTVTLVAVLALVIFVPLFFWQKSALDDFSRAKKPAASDTTEVAPAENPQKPESLSSLNEYINRERGQSIRNRTL